MRGIEFLEQLIDGFQANRLDSFCCAVSIVLIRQAYPPIRLTNETVRPTFTKHPPFSIDEMIVSIDSRMPAQVCGQLGEDILFLEDPGNEDPVLSILLTIEFWDGFFASCYPRQSIKSDQVSNVVLIAQDRKLTEDVESHFFGEIAGLKVCDLENEPKSFWVVVFEFNCRFA